MKMNRDLVETTVKSEINMVLGTLETLSQLVDLQKYANESMFCLNPVSTEGPAVAEGSDQSHQEKSSHSIVSPNQ